MISRIFFIFIIFQNIFCETKTCKIHVRKRVYQDTECSTEFEKIKTGQITCDNVCFVGIQKQGDSSNELFLESEDNFGLNVVKVGQKTTKTKVNFRGMENFEIYRMNLGTDTVQVLVKTAENVFAGFINNKESDASATLFQIGKIGLSDAKLEDSWIIAVRANGRKVERSIFTMNDDSFQWYTIYTGNYEIQNLVIQKNTVFVFDGVRHREIPLGNSSDSSWDPGVIRISQIPTNGDGDGKQTNVSSDVVSIIVIAVSFAVSIIVISVLYFGYKCYHIRTITARTTAIPMNKVVVDGDRQTELRACEPAPLIRRDDEINHLISDGLGNTSSFQRGLERQQQRRVEHHSAVAVVPTSPDDFLD